MISRLVLDGPKVTREERILEGFDKRVRDIRQGPDGFLYFLTDEGNASIYRLEPGT
jgi:glucose/arabinose dehydrogenase